MQANEASPKTRKLTHPQVHREGISCMLDECRRPTGANTTTTIMTGMRSGSSRSSLSLFSSFLVSFLLVSHSFLALTRVMHRMMHPSVTCRSMTLFSCKHGQKRSHESGPGKLLTCTHTSPHMHISPESCYPGIYIDEHWSSCKRMNEKNKSSARVDNATVIAQ